ncbi:MAG: IclR family transcriptional regulator [Planctomycetota bacterium]|jgi:DNA-binding IclR family transcriptional regulator|nr:IclR family transcriptional regulator [Planctomycetota bacterium]
MAGNDYTINAVQKALRILKLFEGEDEMSLSRISKLSGIGKSTTLRFLYTLHKEGFVAYDEVRKVYSLGLVLFELGMRKYQAMDFHRTAIPQLWALADKTGCICYLGVNWDDTLLMLEKVFPKMVPTWAQLMTPAGGNLPLYSTGIGRLFLAHMPDERVAAYLDRVEFAKLTPDTIVDKDAILELVVKARREKVAYCYAENEPYISSICAPIYDYSGTMVAGISVGGVSEVVHGPDQDRYKRLVVDAAADISRRIGYRETGRKRDGDRNGQIQSGHHRLCL